MEKEQRKEVLTKDNIQKDIKRIYRWKIKDFSICTIFSLVCFILFCCYFELSNLIFISIFTFLIVLNLWVIGYLFHLIYCYFKKPLEYLIVNDRFIGTGIKRTLTIRERCLCFASYGRFAMQNFQTYYHWSKYYQMDNQRLERSSVLGDDFYLVIINKKILNVYNTKLFELKD